jgi:hypothetical protein
MFAESRARLNTLATTLTLVVTLLVAPSAHAVLLNYSFSGVAGIGSSIDVGGGAVNVSGVAFTATGSTVNDVDLFNGGAVGDGFGQFAATTTYDFGGALVFVTDTGADFYIQDCAGAAAVSCAGLTNSVVNAGFLYNFAPAVAGNPDFGVPLGTQTASSANFTLRTQTNAAGHSLTINNRSASASRVTVKAVPEPGTAVMLLLALGGLGATVRRRR